jgi:uncharacterized membrane protein
MPATTELPLGAKKNIEIIAEVEQQLLRKRSVMERVGEGIARYFGSLSFIAAHLVFLTAWVLLNIAGGSVIRPFDPYPFPLLALVVGVEFIFLTTFVLINQKHQIARMEQWAHLHLQLSMLTEQEVTKNMQMLVLICRRLGIEKAAADHELTEMTQSTSVTAVVDELEKSREVGPKTAPTIDTIRDGEKELLCET